MHTKSAIIPSCLWALLATIPGHARVDQAPLTPSADRAAFMRQHFDLVMAVDEAIIRGDVQAAKKQARTLADRPDPQNLPAAAAPYLVTLKHAAARVAAAETIADVASATASMLATCGDCHRAVGTMPAHVPPASASVGGAVGHMLAHKSAVDLMVQGLTVPSSSLWQQGADALGTAPLRRGDLPKDPKLTKDILDTEKWVHEMADRARQATLARSRILVYGELIQSCGTCHALHGNVWGPGKR